MNYCLVVYLQLPQALRKAFLFSVNARQSVNASGACGKELETNRLAGFCVEAIMTEKLCSVCGDSKPVSEFGVGRRQCNSCRSENSRQWCKDNPERTKETKKKYAAANKDKYRDYHRDYAKENAERIREQRREYSKANSVSIVAKVKKWKEENKQKAIDIQRRWRANNLEKARTTGREWATDHKDQRAEYERQWRKDHPEEARQKVRNRRALRNGSVGTITTKEWRAVLDAYGHKCLYPGCEETKVTMDHVKPLALGGTNTADNVQPLCAYHNRSKGAKHIDYRPFVKREAQVSA